MKVSNEKMYKYATLSRHIDIMDPLDSSKLRELLAGFKTSGSDSIGLKELLHNHALLDKVNESLIKRRILLNKNTLNLSIIGLTRFPASIFDDDNLKSFFLNLKK